MINQTFDEIFTLENIYKAHLQGRKCKRKKRSIVRFEMATLCNVYASFEKVRKFNLKRIYHTFVVKVPKIREIQTLSYDQRILQHALCDKIFMPYFTRLAITDNCACQKGKGVFFALERLEKQLQKFVRLNGCEGYVLKCDIKKYFPSIPHKQLKEIFGKHIKDDKLKNFFYKIVDDFCTDESYLKKYDLEPFYDDFGTGRGVPIGNQISQVFGMFYLNDVDRLVKEKLKIKIYSRYMDDFMLIHEDKEVVKNALEEIKCVVEKLGLTLNTKTQFFPLKNGFTYLGFRFIITDSGKIVKKLIKKTTKRFYERSRFLRKAYHDGVIDKERIKSTWHSCKGHLSHADSFVLEQKLYQNLLGGLDGTTIS